MKIILQSLIIFFLLFSSVSKAQIGTNACNPQFAVQFLSANTVKFNPAITTDSPYVQHYWTFGDGSPVSNTISPVHDYYAPGSYSIKHIVRRHNPNNVPVCIDSMIQQITITLPCYLNASFGFQSDTANSLQINFTNFSAGFAPGDSIRWTFGEGSVSYLNNPSHLYANPGTYTVCLRVKKASTTGAPCVSEFCFPVQVMAAINNCNLQAYFAHTANAANPQLIQFSNQSPGYQPTDTVRWTFGDGTSSSLPNPSHVYTAPGTYTVCLRLSRPSTPGTAPCVREYCKVITIAPACNLNASFTSQPATGNPMQINFTNTSAGFAPGDSIRWTFGDGTVSYLNNPSHTYTAPGVYTVCLRVKKPQNSATAYPCVSEVCHQVQVMSPTNYCNLQAYFTIDSLQPNVYHFNNQSPGYLPTDSIRWSFGDGTFSGGTSPTHTYALPATYTACIKIIRYTVAGTAPCIREYCKIIHVPQPSCNLTANFTWYRDSTATVNNTYHFTNTSVPLNTSDSIRWTFGDGTSSNQVNPNHVYAQPGTYIVCLRIQKRNSAGVLSNCIREICRTVIVQQMPPPTPIPCTQLSKYNFVRSASNATIITFTPDHIENNVQYTWTFGDGTGSQSPVSTHQYASPGYYTVCLTAYRSNTCAFTTCKSVYVPANCTNITLGFTATPDSLVPNRVRFITNSNTAITHQLWTITRMPATPATGTATINQNNPTYVFLDSGYYRVCLKATFAGGCVKDICRIIYISHPMPGTSSCMMQVYPNPTSSSLNATVILAQPYMLYAYVYNSMNMLVAQKQQQGVVGSNTVSVPVANLPAGVYTFRLVYGNQVCYSTFIKQ